MNCLDVFDRPIDDFIDRMRDEMDRLIVFLHVPKTAGSSVQRDLVATFRNGYSVDWKSVDRSWETFMSTYPSRRFHHVRGHIGCRHLEMLDNRNIAYHAASFLRHPVQRILSNYHYCISSNSPRQAINRSKYPDLMPFINDCVNVNHMTQLLVGNCDSVNQAIEKISRRYSFIGMQEFYDVCQSIWMRSLGAMYRRRPKLNVTQKNGETTVDDLPKSILDRILETQRIDMGVFEFFDQRYSKLVNSHQLIAS